MDLFYGILILVAIAAGYIFLKKVIGAGVDATTKVATQKLLYKSEHQQAMQMVSAPVKLSIPTKAPVIMREVTAQVATAELPLGLKAVVYESSRSADRITYAFGNKLVPKSFEVEVRFAGHDETTDVILTVLNWREKDGLLLGRENLEKVRAQILAGFTSAGADATVADSFSVKHGPVPAFFADQTGFKKNAFGAAAIVLGLIAIVKLSVIGYYPSEGPLYIGMLVVAGVCGYMFSKIKVDKSGGNSSAGGHSLPAVHAAPTVAGQPSPAATSAQSRPASTATTVSTVAAPGAFTAAAHDAAATPCSSCAAPLKPGASFCTACGAAVRPPHRFCSDCGVEMAAEARFCQECGTPVVAMS